MISLNQDSPYFPKKQKAKKAAAGSFRFGAAYAAHPHLYSQMQGLLDAGGELAVIYDDNSERLSRLAERFPQAKVAYSEAELLGFPDLKLITAAGIPSERAAFGHRVMRAGMDYLVDKCPFTTLEQLRETERVVAETQRLHSVYFAERLHTESGWYLGELARQGVFGQLIHCAIMGPHKLGVTPRPDWFFQKAKTGGILTDICSHQFDQFIDLANCVEGGVLHARVDNLANPDKPEFEDFGEAILKMANGMSCHSRVDWFTPKALPTFGDGRTFLVGTKATAEARKYIDPASGPGELLIIVDEHGEHRLELQGRIGFPFFHQLIEDCLQRTDKSLPMRQSFAAARLSLIAQQMADQARKVVP
jgi:predicted dehydrogenase